jgi:ribosome-associated toxin RatA of RatAB toxin-antitoxin module
MAIQVQETQVVRAPLAATWAAVSQMQAVQDWHPNVARATVLSDAKAGVGASRRVEFQDGNSVVETVIEESDQNFTTMEMSDAPMMKRALVTIRTTQNTAGDTEVTFDLRYSMKLGPLGWLMGSLMMKPMMRNVFKVALAGLSYHLETGELVHDKVPERAA